MAFVDRILDGMHGIEPPASVDTDFERGASAVRELLARIAALQQVGFSCHVASARTDILAQLSALSPSLIILDVIGYDRATRDLQRQLREHSSTSGTPLIILTSDTRPQLRERASQIGFEGYLVKPALPTQLYTEICRIGVPVRHPFGLNFPGAVPAS